ncbi:hypothetical protein ACOSP7_031659 [Xanthoceras sorbifolium]
MMLYLNMVRALSKRFRECRFTRISMERNSQADALAKLASTTEAKLPRTITITELPNPSVEVEEEIMTTERNADEGSCMQPIIRFLQDGQLPADRLQARKIVRITPRYMIHHNVLYKRSYSHTTLEIIPEPSSLRLANSKRSFGKKSKLSFLA